MLNQINYLATILTAGLSQKAKVNVDWTQADWGVLLPFLEKNRLMGIAQRGLKQYIDNGLPMPSKDVWKTISSQAVSMNLENIALHTNLMALARKWGAEDKRPLALGGIAFAPYYPNPRLDYSTELECVAVYKEGKGKDDAAETSFEEGRLKVKVVETATSSFRGQNGDHEDAVLRKAFLAGPCGLDPGTLVAYPNLNFRALYLLYTAQQQLLHNHLPFGKLLDWAMVIRRVGETNANIFCWELFLEQVEDLGLLPFVQNFTALAVRLTGVDVPALGKSLLVDGADTDYLFTCITADAPTTDGDGNRFSRFVGVLRNKKKYEQFSEVSPTKQAFRYLFGKD